MQSHFDVPRRNLGQARAQLLWRADGRWAMSTRLLARTLRYLLPVGDPSRRSLGIQSDYAEFSRDRNQGSDAKFRRFLDDHVHRVGLH